MRGLRPKLRPLARPTAAAVAAGLFVFSALAIAQEPAAPPSQSPAGAADAADAAPNRSAPAQSPDLAEPQPLRFAVLAGRSVAATMQAVGPVATDLAELLRRPVEILPMSSYDAMIAAQEQRRIDGGFYSAAAFALAEARCGCLEPIVAPRAADGTLAFHAVIVTRSTSGIGSVADLEGRTIAVGADDSIGARRMQLAALMADGIDPASFFGGVLTVGSAEEAVRLLAGAAADAAFAWSSLTGNVERGYSRGTLSNLVASGEISMDDITLIWRSPPITHGPFAVLSTLPAADRDAIESYLVRLEDANPAAYDLLNPFYAGGYAPVDPPDYSGLELLAAENVEALGLPEAVESAAQERR